MFNYAWTWYCHDGSITFNESFGVRRGPFCKCVYEWIDGCDKQRKKQNNLAATVTRRRTPWLSRCAWDWVRNSSSWTHLGPIFAFLKTMKDGTRILIERLTQKYGLKSESLWSIIFEMSLSIYSLSPGTICGSTFLNSEKSKLEKNENLLCFSHNHVLVARIWR